MNRWRQVVNAGHGILMILCETIVLSGVVVLATSCTTLRGFKPPPSDIAEVMNDSQHRGAEFIRQAWGDCGSDVLGPTIIDGFVDNVRATRQECMFNKGLYRRDGDGGMCSRPPYRTKLPVCKIVPQRPRNHYYASPPIYSNLQCVNTDMLNRGCIP